jgi:CheY-like chemotaxis protein
MQEAKLVIIEDNPDKMKIFRDHLELGGHIVIAELVSMEEVNESLDGLLDNPDTRPDVVLVDGILDESRAREQLNTGQIDGDRIIERIKERHVPVKIIGISSSLHLREADVPQATLPRQVLKFIAGLEAPKAE